MADSPKDLSLTEEKRIGFLETEWTTLSASADRNRDQLNMFRRYLLVLIIVLLALTSPERTVFGLPLDQRAWLLGTPVILVLLFRISAEVQFLYFKMQRILAIEATISEISGSPDLFAYATSRERQLERVGKLSKTNLPMSLLTFLIVLSVMVYAEFQAWAWLRGCTCKPVNIAQIAYLVTTFGFFLFWCVQVALISHTFRSKE